MQFFYEYILILFYINKKLKFLTKQNVRITTKILSSLIKIIKHFGQEKKIKTMDKLNS